MSTIVQHTWDHRGMQSSRCPRCNTLFAYWDDEDLDDNGDLRCFCDAEAQEKIEKIVGREPGQPWPAFAWPGGYAIFYLADDGEMVCAECMSAQDEIHFSGEADGWRIDAAGAFGATDDFPEEDEHCAHCNKVIYEGMEP